MVYLEPGRSYVVGRETGCDVVMEDDRISRRHLCLRQGTKGWIAEDLGSKNGTLLDGTPLKQAEVVGPAWLSLGGLMARLDVLAPETPTPRPPPPRPASTEVGPVLTGLLRSVLSLSGAARGFILLEGPGPTLELAEALGIGRSDLTLPAFRGSASAVRRCLATGKAVVVSDAQEDPSVKDRPSVVRGAIGNLLCLPLKVLNRTLGVVYADGEGGRPPLTELDLELLEAVASQAAAALWAARMQEDLDRLLAVLPPGEGDLARTAARLRISLGAEPLALPEFLGSGL